MPLEKAAQWKAEAEDWMVQQLRADSPPAKMADCIADENWSQIYRFFCEKNFVTENLEFLEEVRVYKAAPSVDEGDRIYDKFVPSSAETQINLYSDNKLALDTWKQNPGRQADADLFDPAYVEIWNMTENDSYARFIAKTAEVKKELLAEDDQDGEEEADEIEISAPQLKELSIDDVEQAVVDQWNERTLKDLKQNAKADFIQIDDLVIMVHPEGKDAQPYVKWARKQPGRAEGTVTMVEKGGAFSAGSVRAEGTGDQGSFEAAVKRVSKKKVTF